MVQRGTITLTFEPISQEETARFKTIFDAIFLSGGLNVRNGQVVLHFDHEGTLQLIETHEKRWLKRKEGARPPP